MKRALIRMLGAILSVFVSGRADATVTITTACPNCQYRNGAICDESTAYTESSTVANAHVAMCIRESNWGDGYPVITDSGCVSKLKEWGLCTNVRTAGSYFLYNTGLSCSSGSSTSYTTTYCGYTYTDTGKSYNGIVEMSSSAGTGVTYDYACCDVNSGFCCLTQGSCIYQFSCGYCANESGYCGITMTLSVNSSVGGSACPQALQEYFSTAVSTGWCSGNSIYVEGTGALLIANACYGTTGYVVSSALNWVCGLILDSCKYANGYYRTAVINYPLNSTGLDVYCATCPAEANNNVGLSGILTVKASSDSTGITSCYGTPINSTVSGSDTSGKYEVTITGDCPYSN